MRLLPSPSLGPAAVVLVGACALGGAVSAQSPARTPGETWRVSTTGSVMGVSPAARVQEICLPRENPHERLIQPPDEDGDTALDKHCKDLAATRSDNRATGRIECNEGGVVMRFTYDVVAEPDRMRAERIRSTVTADIGGLRSTTVTEAVRVGGRCVVGAKGR